MVMIGQVGSPIVVSGASSGDQARSVNTPRDLGNSESRRSVEDILADIKRRKGVLRPTSSSTMGTAQSGQGQKSHSQLSDSASDSHPTRIKHSPSYPISTSSGPPASGGPIRQEGALEPTPLEDILMEEGVISDDQWLRIKAFQEERLSERSEGLGTPGSPRWYERLRLSGWAEMRYNRLGQPNGEVISWQDSSVGKRLGDNALSALVDPSEPEGFLLRRARLTVSGQVSDRVSVKFQPDFATDIDGKIYSLSMKDAWAQYYFDSDKEWRFRAGLQKIPCSFEMWQSSSRRIAIDRSDATASCQWDNRDLALSLQWTPKFAQHRWKRMVDYLFGAGDWGMINLSVYNGQGGSAKERNSDKHVAFRFAYPFELPGGRLLEVGMNAYTGKFSVKMGTPDLQSTKLFSVNSTSSLGREDFRDQRVNFYMYYPPQPWGLLAEFVTGRGPERGSNGVVENRSLQGGYVQAQYMWKYSDTGLANFYLRWQGYRGGLKWATGAPDVTSKELGWGVAWLFDPQWELTFEMAITERKNFESMVALPNGSSCDTSTFNISTTNGSVFVPNPIATCVPPAQFDAQTTLFRLQLQWYFN